MSSSFTTIDFFRKHPKIISFACLAISVISRIINVLYVSYVGGDKIMIAVFSRNFLAGNGLSIPQYFVANPDSVVNNSTPNWPPGYPLLLSAFLKLFNYDLFWASTTIDLIAGIALIVIIRNLCVILGFTNTAINIATLVVGCFNYSFIAASQPTDLVTLTLLFLGYYLVVKVLVKNSVSKSWLIIASFFLVLPTFFRYSYHLAIFCLPMCILVIGYLIKNRLFINKGKFIFLSALLFYFIIAAIQYFISGSIFYLIPTEKGLFLNNFSHVYPFIPASFISLNFVYVKLFTGVFSFDTFYRLSEKVNYIMMTITGFIFLLLTLKHKIYKQPSQFRLFVLTGISISAGIFILLAYVSITNKEQIWLVMKWNYLQEPRYFGFITIFLQLAFIGWLFSGKKPPFKNLLLNVTKYFLAFLLFIEVLHNLYFNIKLINTYRHYKQQHYWQVRFEFIEKSILTLIENNPTKELYVASYTHPTAPHLAAYYGQKGLADSETLNSSLPKVTRPGLLVLHLSDAELPYFKSFFLKTNAIHYSKNDYDNIYLVELKP